MRLPKLTLKLSSSATEEWVVSLLMPTKEAPVFPSIMLIPGHTERIVEVRQMNTCTCKYAHVPATLIL